MESMKTEVQNFEKHLQQRHADLQNQTQRLAQYNVGTNEYKGQEKKIAQMRGELQAEAQLKQEEFLKREAQAYFEFYQKVQQAVSSVAYHHKVSIVLRFNRDDIDPQNRGSILQGVNRPVVYHQQHMDLTDQVLQVMGANATASRTSRPATRTR